MQLKIKKGKLKNEEVSQSPFLIFNFSFLIFNSVYGI